jgi:hypothetical protein
MHDVCGAGVAWCRMYFPLLLFFCSIAMERSHEPLVLVGCAPLDQLDHSSRKRRSRALKLLQAHMDSS